MRRAFRQATKTHAAFADVDAATIRAERIAAIGRQRFERASNPFNVNLQRLSTPPNDSGIATTRSEQSPRGRKRHWPTKSTPWKSCSAGPPTSDTGAANSAAVPISCCR